MRVSHSKSLFSKYFLGGVGSIFYFLMSFIFYMGSLFSGFGNCVLYYLHISLFLCPFFDQSELVKNDSWPAGNLHTLGERMGISERILKNESTVI